MITKVSARFRTRLRLPAAGVLLALLVGLAVACTVERTQTTKVDPPPALYPAEFGPLWGYVNRNGDVVVPPTFDNAERFPAKYAVVTAGAQLGYVDGKGTRVLGTYAGAWAFSEGLAAVRVGDERGYIDLSGATVITPRFDVAWRFVDGLAPVKVGSRWGYIDTKGGFVVQPKYDLAWPFNEKLALVVSGGKKGFVDATGAEVIKPAYDDAWKFTEGLAAVEVGGKWGFIDPTGAMVIQPQFDDAWWFSEGLAPVRVGLKWGYINTKGELKIAPAYDTALEFSEGLAVVRNGSKDSYIDKKGKAPFPTAYDHAWQFIDGRAQIGDAGKRGLIDRAGKKVWDGPTLPPSPTVETSGEAPPPTAAELAQTPPPIGLIVFEGDSLTIGTRASDPYPSQLMRAWGGGTVWWNIGVGGQGVKDMLADAVKQVDSKYDPARGRNVVVVWGGTNDMALWHRSPQQVFDMLEQYCLDRRAKGFQTIMMTALPRAGRVDTEDYEGRRQDLNALIRAHWSEFSDSLVDVAADPRLGEVGDELDRRYYDSDRVHLNNGGLGVIAELVAPALRTLGTKLNVGHGF